MGRNATKPVFRVSDKARLKSISSATETSWTSEILLVASLDTTLSNKRITKALIRLRICAGWSAPLFFANPKDWFSRLEAHMSLYSFNLLQSIFNKCRKSAYCRKGSVLEESFCLLLLSAYILCKKFCWKKKKQCVKTIAVCCCYKYFKCFQG